MYFYIIRLNQIYICDVNEIMEGKCDDKNSLVAEYNLDFSTFRAPTRAIKLKINEPKSISLKNLERFQSLKIPLPHFISFSVILSLTQSCGEAMILHGHRRRIFPKLAMGLTSICTRKF